MPFALLALAAACAAAVVLGPLGFGLIQWHLSADLLNQTYGADAAQLAFVTPAAVAAAILWHRAHRLAPPLALGVALATLYYAVASVLGPDYTRYPGNNERYSLLFLILIVLSWTVAARAWTTLDATPPRPSLWLARGFGSVLIAGGLLIGTAWVAQLLEIAISGTLSVGYAESPSAFWTVRVVDLGIIVPVCLAAGAGLWRGNPSAIRAAYGVASFMTFQAAAVLAMGAVMLWRRDPSANPILTFSLAPLTLAQAVLTFRLLASYARGDAATPDTPPPPLDAAFARRLPRNQRYGRSWSLKPRTFTIGHD
jgi:hypothetical protein